MGCTKVKYRIMLVEDDKVIAEQVGRQASCIVIVIYIAFYFLCYQLTEKEYYNIVMSK